MNKPTVLNYWLEHWFNLHADYMNPREQCNNIVIKIYDFHHLLHRCEIPSKEKDIIYAHLEELKMTVWSRGYPFHMWPKRFEPAIKHYHKLKGLL